MPKICTARLVTAACGLVLAAAAHADASTKDREFLTQAATGGLYEVQAGKLAQNRATANEVKSFGAMLVKDHTAANEELRALAARKGVALPTTLPGDKQKQLDQLAKAQKFDQEFLSQVGLNDHRHDIALFEAAGKDADDPEIQTFALKALPKLKAHKDHAEDLAVSIKR